MIIVYYMRKKMKKKRKTMMSNKIITYVFTSLCGGVGKKTTMSVACAKAHALQGRLGNEDFEFWEE